MNIAILFLDIFLIFILTFIYCSIVVSGREAKEEYEKYNN